MVYGPINQPEGFIWFPQTSAIVGRQLFDKKHPPFYSGIEKIWNSGVGPDPEQSAKNGPE